MSVPRYGQGWQFNIAVAEGTRDEARRYQRHEILLIRRIRDLLKRWAT